MSCAVCDIVDNVDIMDGLYLGFAVCGIVEDVDEVIDNIVCVGITASDLVDKGKVSDGLYVDCTVCDVVDKPNVIDGLYVSCVVGGVVDIVDRTTVVRIDDILAVALKDGPCDDNDDVGDGDDNDGNDCSDDVGFNISDLVDKGHLTVSCAVCDIVDNVDIMDGLYLGFAVCVIVEDVDEVIDNIVCVGITASDLVDKGKVSDGLYVDCTVCDVVDKPNVIEGLYVSCVVGGVVDIVDRTTVVRIDDILAVALKDGPCDDNDDVGDGDDNDCNDCSDDVGFNISDLVDKGHLTVSCAVCDIVDNVDIMDGLCLGFAVCGIVEDVDEVIDNIVCVGITASDLVDKGKVSDGLYVDCTVCDVVDKPNVIDGLYVSCVVGGVVDIVDRTTVVRIDDILAVALKDGPCDDNDDVGDGDDNDGNDCSDDVGFNISDLVDKGHLTVSCAVCDIVDNVDIMDGLYLGFAVCVIVEDVDEVIDNIVCVGITASDLVDKGKVSDGLYVDCTVCDVVDKPNVIEGLYVSCVVGGVVDIVDRTTVVRIDDILAVALKDGPCDDNDDVGDGDDNDCNDCSDDVGFNISDLVDKGHLTVSCAVCDIVDNVDIMDGLCLGFAVCGIVEDVDEVIDNIVCVGITASDLVDKGKVSDGLYVDCTVCDVVDKPNVIDGLYVSCVVGGVVDIVDRTTVVRIDDILAVALKDGPCDDNDDVGDGDDNDGNDCSDDVGFNISDLVDKGHLTVSCAVCDIVDNVDIMDGLYLGFAVCGIVEDVDEVIDNIVCVGITASDLVDKGKVSDGLYVDCTVCDVVDKPNVIDGLYVSCVVGGVVDIVDRTTVVRIDDILAVDLKDGPCDDNDDVGDGDDNDGNDCSDDVGFNIWVGHEHGC